LCWANNLLLYLGIHLYKLPALTPTNDVEGTAVQSDEEQNAASAAVSDDDDDEEEEEQEENTPVVTPQPTSALHWVFRRLSYMANRVHSVGVRKC